MFSLKLHGPNNLTISQSMRATMAARHHHPEQVHFSLNSNRISAVMIQRQLHHARRGL